MAGTTQDDSTWPVKKKDRHHYALQEPIVIGEEQITELWFRKPKARDLMHVDLSKPSGEDFLGVASKLTGRAVDVLMEMSPGDYFETIAIVAAFLERGQPTGATASPASPSSSPA